MKNYLFLIAVLTSTALFAQNTQSKQSAKEPLVLISTSYGDIKVKLYNETPQHRDNFLKLANEGFYNGTLFHRVISGFMIQGGDPGSKDAKPGQMLGSGDLGYTVPAEFHDHLVHKKGALSAARTNNPEKASSASQFYLVQGKVYSDQELTGFESRLGFTFTPEQRKAYTTIGGTPHLDREYTVYGEVVEGIEVIDKIAALKTDANNRPDEDVKMTVKVLNQ